METILDKKEVMTMPYANPAEVEKCLKGINYPAKKDDSPIDVSKAVGEVDRRQ
jgi:hypothetical protein